MLQWILSLFNIFKSPTSTSSTEVGTKVKKENKMNKPDWVLKLTVERYYLGEIDTVGRLYATYATDTSKKELICYVLEDKVRNTPDIPEDLFEKVYGETAIPYGTYEVIISHSNRFKKDLPELLNVPHFTGVRIHTGNSAADSEGCLICGDTPKLSDKGSWVSNSKVNFTKLMNILTSAVKQGKVIIEIKNAE